MMNSVSTVSVPQRSKAQSILLATGFSGILFVVTFLILGAIAPGYDSIRETISALEFTDVSIAQRVNFFLFGLLLIAFAVALRKELGTGRGAILIPIFQSLTGIGVIAHNFCSAVRA